LKGEICPIGSFSLVPAIKLPKLGDRWLQMTEAYAGLGFLAYLTGQTSEVVRFYHIKGSINPKFFLNGRRTKSDYVG